MKNIVLLCISVFLLSSQNMAQTGSISGKVMYDKTNFTARIDSCQLTLFLDGNPVAVANTDSQGNYLFENLNPGTYLLKVTLCNKAWGGGGNTDALLILRHFVGMPPLLTGLRLKAAYVDNNSYVNPVDALMIAKRFVGMISTFPSGDWVFEEFTLESNDQPVVQNIRGLCVGDVNASFNPF